MVTEAGEYIMRAARLIGASRDEMADELRDDELFHLVQLEVDEVANVADLCLALAGAGGWLLRLLEERLGVERDGVLGPDSAPPAEA